MLNANVSRFGPFRALGASQGRLQFSFSEPVPIVRNPCCNGLTVDPVLGAVILEKGSSMSTDLKYLAYTAMLTAALWIPYVVCQVMTNGFLTQIGRASCRERV